MELHVSFLSSHFLLCASLPEGVLPRATDVFKQVFRSDTSCNCMNLVKPSKCLML